MGAGFATINPAVARTTFYPLTNSAYDLGTSSKLFRDIYLSRNVVLGASSALISSNTSDGSDNKEIVINGGGANSRSRGAAIYIRGNEFATYSGNLDIASGNPGNISLDAISDISLNHNGAVNWVFNSSGHIAQNATNGGDIVFNKNNSAIRAGTSDASDNINFSISGGGALSSSRGGYTTWSGNEVATVGGSVQIIGGNISSGNVDLYTTHSTPAVRIYTNSLLRWYFNGGNLIQDATNGSDVILNNSDAIIRQGTSDAADNKSITVAGGGGTSNARGSKITFYGNEYASVGGSVVIVGGGISTGHITLQTQNSSAYIDFQTNALARWKVTSAGHLQQDATNGGDIILSKSSMNIYGTSSDGSDNQELFLNPTGQTFGTTNRGGGIRISGNESGNAGSVLVHTGNTTFCTFDNKLGGSQSKYRIVDNSDVLKFAISADNKFEIDKTNTAGGTTGAQTINKAAGSVNFAAAATSLVVTNNTVTTSSLVFVSVMTNDTTMKSAQAVAGSGSFTIYANAAATAETKVAFWVLN